MFALWKPSPMHCTSSWRADFRFVLHGLPIGTRGPFQVWWPSEGNTQELDQQHDFWRWSLNLTTFQVGWRKRVLPRGVAVADKIHALGDAEEIATRMVLAHQWETTIILCLGTNLVRSSIICWVWISVLSARHFAVMKRWARSWPTFCTMAYLTLDWGIKPKVDVSDLYRWQKHESYSMSLTLMSCFDPMSMLCRNRPRLLRSW